MSTRTLRTVALVLAGLGVLLLIVALLAGRHDTGVATPDVPSSARTSDATASPSPNAATNSSSPDPSAVKPSGAVPSAPAAVAPGEQDLSAWTTPGPQRARQESRAVQAATRAMSVYARPGAGVTDQAWRQRVRAAVGVQAWERLANVDPGRVRFSRLTGPARVLEPDDEQPAAEGDQDAVMVAVPTDAGWWQVLVVEDVVTSISPLPGTTP